MRIPVIEEIVEEAPFVAFGFAATVALVLRNVNL